MPKQDRDPSPDRRTFSQEVRLGYVERMAAGEVVSALAVAGCGPPAWPRAAAARAPEGGSSPGEL